LRALIQQRFPYLNGLIPCRIRGSSQIAAFGPRTGLLC
jgi:hypothetical protein